MRQWTERVSDITGSLQMLVFTLRYQQLLYAHCGFSSRNCVLLAAGITLLISSQIHKKCCYWNQSSSQQLKQIKG